MIAEVQPVLARTLARLLGEAWPELRIAGVAEDGLRATEPALAEAPDVVFLDIMMPGRNGIEVAEAVADDRPDDRAEPLFVFVTAFDEFAVSAFERAAPMQRVQAIALPAPAADAGERIKVIRAGVGNTVRKIPVAEVVCFEVTEKYVNVGTPTGEALVRMSPPGRPKGEYRRAQPEGTPVSLRELMAGIDSSDLIQVHRSVMVNSGAILNATRDENGHYSLAVRGLQRPLKMSRALGHLFRPM